MKKFFGQKQSKFTVDNCVNLCKSIQRLEAQPTAKPALLIENLRELAEVLVWGDKNNTDIFDVFLERALMPSFVKLVVSPSPTEVKVQAIQSLTILIQNATQPGSVFYILSNNYINRILSYTFDFHDDEILSNYIAFIKTLSLRLDPTTVQFFFSGDSYTFPLYTESLKFVDHEDRMVRAAIRQILLNVLRVSDAELARFISETGAKFYNQFCWYVRRQMSLVSEAVSTVDAATHMVLVPPDVDCSDQPELPSYAAVDAAIEDLVDDLYYINDLLELPEAEYVRQFREQLYSTIFAALGRCHPVGLLVIAAHWLSVCTCDELEERLITELLVPCFDKSEPSKVVAALRSGNQRLLAPALNIVYHLLQKPSLPQRTTALLLGLKEEVAGRKPAWVHPQKWELPLDNSSIISLQAEMAAQEATDVVEGTVLYLPANIEIPSSGKRPVRAGETVLSAVLEAMLTQVNTVNSLRLDVLCLTAHVASELMARTKLHEPAAVQAATDNATMCFHISQAVLQRRVENTRGQLYQRYTPSRGASQRVAQILGSDRPANALLDEILSQPRLRELTDPLVVLFMRLHVELSSASYRQRIVNAKVGRETHSLLPVFPFKVDAGLLASQLSVVPSLDDQELLGHSLGSNPSPGSPASVEKQQQAASSSPSAKEPPAAAGSQHAGTAVKATSAAPAVGSNTQVAASPQPTADMPTRIANISLRYFQRIAFEKRPPRNAEELERLEIHTFLVMHTFFHSMVGRPDPLALVDSVRAATMHPTMNEEVRVTDFADVCLKQRRVSYAPRDTDTYRLKDCKPGESLYWFITPNGVALIKPSRDVINSGSVVYSCPVFFAEAVVSPKQRHQVTLRCETTNFATLSSVTVAEVDRASAATLAHATNSVSRSSHDAMCKLMRSMLSYSPCEEAR